MFEVDVITPVYNNVHFIRKCVESAHDNDEVRKVLVVDDGSTDGTLQTLQQMARDFPKLVILIHPNGVNRGIACSRNLAIKHAEAKWIAFLDSDDYYLPGRFATTKKIIETCPAIDGVYEPVVNKVLSREGEKRFVRFADDMNDTVIRILPDIPPDKVFEMMYNGRGGVVHMNGLTIRRELALSIGMFDENLKIVDDSIFRLKAAYKGKLMRGSDLPVAVRTIHDSNNEPNIAPFDNFKKYEVLLNYLIRWGANSKLKRTLIHRTLFNYMHYRHASTKFQRIKTALSYLTSNPKLLIHYVW